MSIQYVLPILLIILYLLVGFGVLFLIRKNDYFKINQSNDDFETGIRALALMIVWPAVLIIGAILMLGKWAGNE